MNMGGLKDSDGKCEFDRLSWQAMGLANEVHKYGDTKYEKGNWRKGIHSSKLINASLRHLFKFLDGEIKDQESGLPHVAHALVNCEMVLHYYINELGYKEYLDIKRRLGNESSTKI